MTLSEQFGKPMDSYLPRLKAMHQEMTGVAGDHLHHSFQLLLEVISNTDSCLIKIIFIKHQQKEATSEPPYFNTNSLILVARHAVWSVAI